MAVVLVAGGGGAAVAYVTAGGRGVGAVAVQAPDDVLAVAGTVTGLYPGGPPASVDVTVTNREALPLTVTDITPDLASLPADCPASAWDVRPDGGPVTVPAHGGLVVPVRIGLTASAPQQCQGADLTIGLDVAGRLG